MRKDYIHSIQYILPVVKDDYGNDFWLALVNTKKQHGYSHYSGYCVISKTGDISNGYVDYATEAFWKVKERNLLLIEKDGYYIEEYKERMHGLEWKPTSQTGYQPVPKDDLRLVTRFYVRKESNKESTWHTDPPEKEGAYICRMADAYIKVCYWNTIEWKDMWKDTLQGQVKEWMHIPYNKN